MSRRVNLVDTTLRDGMNSLSHQFTSAHVIAIAGGLDAAGVGTIEVTHGDGLGGSSIQLGRAAESDVDLVGTMLPQLDGPPFEYADTLTAATLSLDSGAQLAAG